MKMNKPVKRKNFLGFTEKVILLIAHLLLLKWILFVLENANSMQNQEVTLHFLGLAAAGSFLIYLCANLAKFRYQQEVKKSK